MGHDRLGLVRRLRAAVHAFRRPGIARPWDHEFARWIADARRRGIDPNDVADEAWKPGEQVARDYVLPHVDADSVVLELGPGSGRITRRVLPHVREMVLVDYSEAVCRWLDTYLRGSGAFRIHHIDAPAIPMVPAASVDFAFAQGVFEHLDLEDLTAFLEELRRVLRAGAGLYFDFDTLMSDEGLETFWRTRGQPGERSPFRFHHPETVRRVLHALGFVDVRMGTWSPRSRFVLVQARNPGLSSRDRDAPPPWSHDL